MIKTLVNNQVVQTAMLITQKGLLNSSSPFLMQTATRGWLLVESITLHEGVLKLAIIEKIEERFSKRIMQLDETPFYVGADVWELNYGTTLMTLNHETLAEHPAMLLWQEWLSSTK